MKEETREVNIEGRKTKVKLLSIDEKDRPQLRKLYDSWRLLHNGMKNFKSRGINIPEGISESAFCLDFDKNCVRAISVSNGSGSFDVLNLQNGKRIQIKAMSVKSDLTSFGPKSVWDELYFLDFYREGKFDGTFDVYLIPNDLIYKHKMNSTQIFLEQQKQGRRPRLCIKDELIGKHCILPLKTCKI